MGVACVQEAEQAADRAGQEASAGQKAVQTAKHNLTTHRQAQARAAAAGACLVQSHSINCKAQSAWQQSCWTDSSMRAEAGCNKGATVQLVCACRNAAGSLESRVAEARVRVEGLEASLREVRLCLSPCALS